MPALPGYSLLYSLGDMLRPIFEPIVHNPFFVQYGLLGLFLNGLFSSVVPIPTEFTTTALLLAGEDRLNIFIVLAISSIAGGFLAYFLGRTGSMAFRAFHAKPKASTEERSYAFLKKYGWVAIFISPWIPVFGDVVPIIAGTKNYEFGRFAVAMCVGKAVKVLAIVYFSSLLVPLLFSQV
ncbi:MAG: VTT domain-containing protein [Nitrososphaera sp.]